MATIHGPFSLGFFPNQRPRPKVGLRFFYWSTRVAGTGSFRRYAFKAPWLLQRFVCYWHIVYMRFYRA